MQIEHKTEKGTVRFVKVPDDYKSFSVNPYSREGNSWLWVLSGYNTRLGIPLPNGNWQIIGLTNEVTEEQAKMMVPNIGDYYPNYKNSEPINFIFPKALYSFNSLMQHLKNTDEKWIVLFKPND